MTALNTSSETLPFQMEAHSFLSIRCVQRSLLTLNLLNLERG